MTQSTLDMAAEAIISDKVKRATPKDICIRCGGIGVVYSRKGFNGRNPSRPVQCPDCGGTGSTSEGLNEPHRV